MTTGFIQGIQEETTASDINFYQTTAPYIPFGINSNSTVAKSESNETENGNGKVSQNDQEYHGPQTTNTSTKDDGKAADTTIKINNETTIKNQTHVFSNSGDDKINDYIPFGLKNISKSTQVTQSNDINRPPTMTYVFTSERPEINNPWSTNQNKAFSSNSWSTPASSENPDKTSILPLSNISAVTPKNDLNFGNGLERNLTDSERDNHLDGNKKPQVAIVFPDVNNDSKIKPFSVNSKVNLTISPDSGNGTDSNSQQSTTTSSDNRNGKSNSSFFTNKKLAASAGKNAESYTSFYVILSLTFISAVSFIVVWGTYQIKKKKKRSKKCSIVDPSDKYIIRVKHVKPVEPIIYD